MNESLNDKKIASWQEPSHPPHCYGCTNDATVLCEEIKRLREALEMIATHRDLSGPTAGAYVAKEALKHG